MPSLSLAFDIQQLNSCKGVAVKTLVLSDTLAEENKSKASEIRNIRNLEQIFGKDKKLFQSEYVYLGKKETVRDKGKATWYNFKSKSAKATTHYRLYYSKNEVMKVASAGDLLVVCKKDENNVLLLLVAQKDSNAFKEVYDVLGLDSNNNKKDKKTWWSKLWTSNKYETTNVIDYEIETSKLSIDKIPSKGWIRVYFTPGPDCEDNIIELISNAKKNIDVAVYSITNDKIVDALIDAKNRGTQVRIITDRLQSRGKSSLVPKLEQQGFDIKTNIKHKIMHHKFAIFDGKEVETGSYNWTTSATKSNAENCMFFEQSKKEFSQQFNYLWSYYEK